ncbi:hypothetical protein TPHA_0A02210 [Tetrapisispora phaffii CBS 4417]|uniref:SH3 domain-containing protein n=1 Tax=Tetrapisispora phaffii (strain ATCC 24235 / CBS 4417 / NBRC 1672 / NRRL Y-8282 / UCD 70-5) TaxID=1071381 RepID=G8BN25_TETPH|nr:hypothetical protein TPHA_0A02210 [Tetrapisispora phaffii CBS 4417]CCE61303.1 hypothetical protein TPHA_0A02210 [Tetrapisispora phaffii CBS 4417]
MGINNPIPLSLTSEVKKASKILTNFIKPNQLFGADQVIPPGVLKRAKGLAVITVFKAGFLFSGRAGSGIIVARLRDGTWSAPSAIAMAGAGAGGMVGFELTDFVFILNTEEAVRSFSEFGTITLGGNVSVSAGPLGRSAEAAAAASAGGVAAVFTYSKSKGLFAGVSVEGSVIVERREANRKFYGNNCKSKMILSGRVRAPSSVDPLFRVLESRAFSYNNSYNYNDNYDSDGYYNDLPDSRYSSDEDYYKSSTSHSRRNRGDSFSDLDDTEEYRSYANDYNGRERNFRGRDRDYYDNYSNNNSVSNRGVNDVANRFSNVRLSSSRKNTDDSYVSSPIPQGPKAIALFRFKGEQAGDLSFNKGDVVTILKKTDTQNDWWTGRVNNQEGIFPANYVELV